MDDQSLTKTNHPSNVKLPSSGLHSAARLSAHKVSVTRVTVSWLPVKGHYKTGS